MTFYECLEEEAKKHGFKDLTEFCMRAGISAYLQDRFKHNAVLRNDTKEKIAKALRTNQGFVNNLIAKASYDTPPAAEKILEAEEKKEEVKKMEKEVNTVNEQVNTINKQVNTVNTAIKKQEKRAANLEFVYKNIDAYRDLQDTFYLKQAQVYLNKMVEDAENEGAL